MAARIEEWREAIAVLETAEQFNGKLDAKKPVDTASLVAAGLVTNPKDGIRLLAKGTLKAKLDVTVAGASKAAVAAVESAGGTVTIAQAAKTAKAPAAAPDAG